MNETGHKEVELPEDVLKVVAPLGLEQMLQLQQHLTEAIAKAKYSKLRELLASHLWEEADLETAEIMLKLSKGGKRGFIHGEYLKKISCEDFKAIDQPWSNTAVDTLDLMFKSESGRRLEESLTMIYKTTSPFALQVQSLSAALDGIEFSGIEMILNFP